MSESLPPSDQFNFLKNSQDADKLLAEARADSDFIGYLLVNIGDLSTREKVYVLLKLSDEEFELFKKRQMEDQQRQIDLISEDDSILPNKSDRIRTLSQLRGTPIYIVTAETRRRMGPVAWNNYGFGDEDLKEPDKRFDPDDGLKRTKNGEMLSYEEAVEYTKEENARKFYRNYIYMVVTRTKRQRSISTETLLLTRRLYRQKEYDQRKPGTSFSWRYVKKAAEYYLGYDDPGVKGEVSEVHTKLITCINFMITVEKLFE